MKDNPRATRTGRTSKPARRRHELNPHAAGIDCGSSAHYVAVGPEHEEPSVRRFESFTSQLHELADWLVSCEIETVAMESTGVYWVALYEILEARGLEVVLVNARHIKSVPGRKSDVQDCQWLQELHSFGLLRGSFHPSAEIKSLRTYLRHREQLIHHAGDQVRRMQKELVSMNLHLSVVLSDITGTTGLRILRDIVAGEHDPKRLAVHRDRRCHASEEDIEAALTGHYLPEHLLALGHHLALYDTCQGQLRECDQHIEAYLDELAEAQDEPEQALPAPRRRFKVGADNAPRFDLRPVLYQLTGADLTQIDGIGPHAALRLVSELGIDMSRWATAKRFTSWLSLAPNNKVSGDRVLSSRTRASSNRAAQILRLCAMSVGRTDSALGAYYRRTAYRIGKAKAITATARKLAIVVYHVLSGDFTYRDEGADAYDEHHRDRVIRHLTRKADHLGLTLIDKNTGLVLSNVS